ncbi:endoplasmic reticulum junction formation protein lunapark, partial [Phenoliferia sp. Uapishka_3]
MRSWYTKKRDKEETTLRELKKQQREQVEELKRKTGYYSTRNLLEKYDEVIKKNAETRGLPQPNPNSVALPRTPGPPQPPTTPQRAGPQGFSTPTGTPQRGGQQFPLLPPAPSTPAPRTVFDKLADALLGVAAEEGTPNSKYALICAKCFAHNGLVVKEEFDTIQYQCPRCGHLNPRRNAINRPSTGLGVESRRRVQSMMVPPSRPKTDTTTAREEEVPKASVDDTVEGDEDEAEETQEEIMMEERRAKGQPLRQRRKKTDAMDIDD